MRLDSMRVAAAALGVAFLTIAAHPTIAQGTDSKATDQRPANGESKDQKKPDEYAEALAHGGARFIFTGNFATCHACEPVATGYLGFDFDASGRFLGTRLVSVGPPPKT